MNKFNLKKYNRCQCEEMDRYIWCESYRLGYNIAPTPDDRTKCKLDWIKKYAADFRRWANDCKEFYDE